MSLFYELKHHEINIADENLRITSFHRMTKRTLQPRSGLAVC